MTPLEDAKALAATCPPVHAPGSAGKGYSWRDCEKCGRPLDDHRELCLAVVMPRIVAALEAAARLIAYEAEGPEDAVFDKNWDALAQALTDKEPA